MSLLDLMTHFDAAHGKYSRTDKVYTRVRKFDNRTIGVALKHPVTNDPPSASQEAAQDKFKLVQAKVNTAMADPAQRAAYILKWKSQHKYTTLRSYIFAQLYDEETA